MHCGKAKRRLHASRKFTKLSHGSLLHDSQLNIMKKKKKQYFKRKQQLH